MIDSHPANNEVLNEQIQYLNNQNNYDGYKGRLYNPCFADDECPYKKSELMIYGLFERLHRATRGGIIEIKHSAIASQCKVHPKTSQRAIKKFEADGRLIVLRYWKNSYIFVPPDRRIDDMKSRIEAIISQAEIDESWGQNVPKMETKCPQDTYYYKRVSKDQDAPACEPTPKPSNTHSDNQPPDQSGSLPEFDFDGYEDKINESCATIETLPKPKREFMFFKPLGCARSLIASGIPAHIVSDTLLSMIKDWAVIHSNPARFFEQRCRRQYIWWIQEEPMRNEQSEIDKANKIKFEERNYCDR